MSNIYKDEAEGEDFEDDLTILPVKVPPSEKKIKHHATLPDINKGACVVDIAKPRSGKTLRLVNYLQNPNFYADKFDAVYVYSSTMSNGDDTARFLYDQYSDTIYSEYSDSHLQSIIDYQDSIPKASRPKIALVFDDFIAFPNIHKNSLMFKIATSYRHHNIGLLLYNTQMLKYLPPVVRASANYVILSQNSNMKQVEGLAEEYGGTYGVEKWKQIYSIATAEPYGFLYMDLYGFTGHNNNPKAYSNFNKLLYEAPISYSKKGQKTLNSIHNRVGVVHDEDEDE